MELSGVIPPITTPFHNGEPALEPLEDNIRKWNQTRLSGYLVLGSNGEAVYLDEQEKCAVVRKAREAVPPSKCLMVGTGSESTRETIRLTNQMVDCGADCGLVAPPFYFKAGMREPILRDHFTAVAEAARMPILLYNVPQFTGVNLEPGLVARLSEHPNIVGIKDSQGNVGQLHEYLYSSHPDFRVFVGSAPVFFPSLCLGVHGGILAVANVIPEICIQIFELFQQGRFEEARDLQTRMTPLAKAVTVRYGIGGLKAVMDRAGYFGGEPRLPLQRPAPEVTNELQALLLALQDI
jgi:4-hydroxy-2-oxoglutarate aldolase